MTVPKSVMLVVMISSPGLGSITPMAVWTAAVPEVTAWAYFTPCLAAKSCSNWFTFVPPKRLNLPARITSVSCSISSSPKSHCGPNAPARTGGESRSIAIAIIVPLCEMN